MRQWLINIFVSLDRLGSALVGLDPDETISSALGKVVEKGYTAFWPLAKIIDLCALFLFQQTNHCARSIQRDEGLYSSRYNGALKPDQAIKYAIPLQLLGLFVFFNFDTVVNWLVFWS
jgi:hypothetical protein